MGSYGSLLINAAGAWTYTASSAHNEFVAGVTYTDTFDVYSTDRTHTEVTINMVGTDDPAVQSSATVNRTEGNTAAAISTSGTLTITDPDSPVPSFVAQAGTAGNYGTFAINAAGAWTYTASSAHDEFVAGTTYTDTFSVASTVGTLSSVTVRIQGTNDAPVVEAAKTMVVAVGEVATALNIAAPADADSATLTATVSSVPTDGSVHLDAAFGGSAVIAGQALTVAQLTSLTYTAPASGGALTTGFSYAVSDGSASTPATVSIDVHAAGTGITATGGAGNDVLVASSFVDTFTGGAGNDTFVFHMGQAAGDTITDFVSGTDHLAFVGYGTEAGGASVAQVDATHWQINSADGATRRSRSATARPCIRRIGI